MHRGVQSYASARVSSADELLQRHAGLIAHCARRVAQRTGMHDREDDLWTAGAMALIECSSRFDASRGVPFEGFAEQRVRGAMLDELRRQDHLPRRLRLSAAAVSAARRRVEQQLMRAATTEEVATELGVSANTLDELDALQLPQLSLDHAPPGATEGPSPEESVTRLQFTEELQRAIALLPERLQLLLSLHYVEGLTYREIARILDVSEPRVCQLHSQAIKGLRRSIPQR